MDILSQIMRELGKNNETTLGELKTKIRCNERQLLLGLKFLSQYELVLCHEGKFTLMPAVQSFLRRLHHIEVVVEVEETLMYLVRL